MKSAHRDYFAQGYAFPYRLAEWQRNIGEIGNATCFIIVTDVVNHCYISGGTGDLVGNVYGAGIFVTGAVTIFVT